jgi:lipid-A-disaccharide synthase
MKILVSAGEASGDRYSAQLVEALRKQLPEAEFFGCAGRHLREAGVRPVVRAEQLAVVGIFEVVAHIPRIWREFRRLAAAAQQEKPRFAILTDSPDFHLRLARKLHRENIPVFYYVAPQVWAWRKRRVRLIKKFVDQLLCIFPFEEAFFRDNNVKATFVGHPLHGAVATRISRQEFFSKHRLTEGRPLVALLPGSRRGEAARHLPELMRAVELLGQWRPLNFVLPASTTTGKRFFEERISNSAVHIIEGETENAVGHADLALVASGTATVEAALLGTPMVVFYRVSAATWIVGKPLVNVAYYSMVNLLAGRAVVPELIQGDFTAERLAAEAKRLLGNEADRTKMRQDLSLVEQSLRAERPAAERAAEVICEGLKLRGLLPSEASKSLEV